MARAQFADTIMYVDTGALKPANNARVSVFAPGTTTLQTIYTTRSAGATKANPFTTDGTGAAEFWAEWGDYDIKLEDLEVPSRFGIKTIGWQSTTGAGAAVPYTALDPIITRQDVPIGGVIDWWRPNNTIGVPAGYAVCDGTVITSANHDFGTGASITLPDLRNVFVLGANIGTTDGNAAVGGDTAGDAPGIRGSGGSQAHTLAANQIPSHTHSLSVTGSGSGTTDTQGAHNHTHGIPQRWQFNASAAPNGMDFNGGSGTLGTGVAGDHSHNVSVSVSASGTSGATGSGSSHNNMPRYVGLLKIMKVKRN